MCPFALLFIMVCCALLSINDVVSTCTVSSSWVVLVYEAGRSINEITLLAAHTTHRFPHNDLLLLTYHIKDLLYIKVQNLPGESQVRQAKHVF